MLFRQIKSDPAIIRRAYLDAIEKMHNNGIVDDKVILKNLLLKYNRKAINYFVSNMLVYLNSDYREDAVLNALKRFDAWQLRPGADKKLSSLISAFLSVFQRYIPSLSNTFVNSLEIGDSWAVKYKISLANIKHIFDTLCLHPENNAYLSGYVNELILRHEEFLDKKGIKKTIINYLHIRPKWFSESPDEHYILLSKFQFIDQNLREEIIAKLINLSMFHIHQPHKRNNYINAVIACASQLSIENFDSLINLFCEMIDSGEVVYSVSCLTEIKEFLNQNHKTQVVGSLCQALKTVLPEVGVSLCDFLISLSFLDKNTINSLITSQLMKNLSSQFPYTRILAFRLLLKILPANAYRNRHEILKNLHKLFSSTEHLFVRAEACILLANNQSEVSKKDVSNLMFALFDQLEEENLSIVNRTYQLLLLLEPYVKNNAIDNFFIRSISAKLKDKDASQREKAYHLLVSTADRGYFHSFLNNIYDSIIKNDINLSESTSSLLRLMLPYLTEGQRIAIFNKLFFVILKDNEDSICPERFPACDMIRRFFLKTPYTFQVMILNRLYLINARHEVKHSFAGFLFAELYLPHRNQLAENILRSINLPNDKPFPPELACHVMNFVSPKQ